MNAPRQRVISSGKVADPKVADAVPTPSETDWRALLKDVAARHQLRILHRCQIALLCDDVSAGRIHLKHRNVKVKLTYIYIYISLALGCRKTGFKINRNVCLAT